MGEMRNAYKILVLKHEGKRLHVRPRCRWGNMKMVLKEIGYGGVDWILLVENMDDLRAVMNTRKAGNLRPAEWLLASPDALCFM
jgi:hypothetical protein